MRLRWWVLLTSIGLGLSTGGQAQTSRFGTHWVRSESIDQGESFTACGFSFAASLKEDFQGLDYAVVTEGLFLAGESYNERVAALKFGTRRVVAEGGSANAYAIRPYFAWLRGPSGTDLAGNVLRTAPDKDADKLLVRLRFDERLLAVLRESIGSMRLTIAYARGSAAAPVLLPVDLDVISSDRTGADRTRSRREIDAYLDCNRRLLRSNPFVSADR